MHRIAESQNLLFFAAIVYRKLKDMADNLILMLRDYSVLGKQKFR